MKDVVILYIGAGLVLFKRAWGDTDKVPSTCAHAAVAYDTIMNQQVISLKLLLQLFCRSSYIIIIAACVIP